MAARVISTAIGGSDAVANVWPEAALPLPGWHEKVKVNAKLHDLVCSGQMTLREAQAEVSHDWVAAYRQWVSP